MNIIEYIAHNLNIKVTSEAEAMKEGKTEAFISVYKPIAGYKAIMYWLNDECEEINGTPMPKFWEPWNTGVSGYTTREAAIAEAAIWAESEELALALNEDELLRIKALRR
jgi:hypothetical protein